MTFLQPVPQMGFDERNIDDKDIEQALEAREAARLEKSDTDKAYDVANTKATNMLARLELPEPEEGDEPSVVRVGRFRIVKRFVKGGPRSFNAKDRTQTSISLVDAD